MTKKASTQKREETIQRILELPRKLRVISANRLLRPFRDHLELPAKLPHREALFDRLRSGKSELIRKIGEGSKKRTWIAENA